MKKRHLSDLILPGYHLLLILGIPAVVRQHYWRNVLIMGLATAGFYGYLWLSTRPPSPRYRG